MQLEERLPLTLDADGWTILQPAPESRLVYVSNSLGNDRERWSECSNSKKTIAAALKLLRQNQPDWLVLKSGDVFPAEGSNWRWETSGAAADKKTVLTSYGDGPRPILLNEKFWYGHQRSAEALCDGGA